RTGLLLEGTSGMDGSMSQCCGAVLLSTVCLVSLTDTARAQATTQDAPGPSARAPDAAPYVLSLDEARTRALTQVPAIAIEWIGVARAEAAVSAAGAAWDPVLRIDGRVRSHTDPLNTLFSGAPDGALGPRT